MYKALDYNKLLILQAKGESLNTRPHSHYFCSIKYDGNYTEVHKLQGVTRFFTSGGIVYTNKRPTIFHDSSVPDGIYKCERIATDGKLGDRRGCALRGPTGAKIAVKHSYKVFDYTPYDKNMDYSHRRLALQEALHSFPGDIVSTKRLSLDQARIYLKEVVSKGHEGIVLNHAEWPNAQHTTVRNIGFMKWKQRPSADLLVVGITMGEGKYTNLIGSLIVQDSLGRKVNVGSGLSDKDRHEKPSYWINKVVEVYYEQTMDTYIQPTFGTQGVVIRYDKTAGEID